MPRYDPLSKRERSERMSRVRDRNTKPELIVRKMLWAMGYRYRLQGKKLPGRPDIVFIGRRRVIFVHGCFWHQHGCTHYRMPKTRKAFWNAKLAANVKRDGKNQRELKKAGWRVLVLWECQLKKGNLTRVERRIRRFMSDEGERA